MRVLLLLPLLCCLAWGNPEADAEAEASALADADAEAGADPEAIAQLMGASPYPMPQYNQVGGPGFAGPPFNYQSGQYRPPMPVLDMTNMAGRPMEEMGDNANPPMGPYGSLSMPGAGSVMPVENGLNSLDSTYDNNGLIAPMPSPPINSQGQMFTRSYTSLPSWIPGRRCWNVCRQRPNYWGRPSCRPACNVRPACSTRRPRIDYQVQGRTVYCKPKPIQPQCGNWWGGCGGSGYNPGNNGGSGYNPGNNGGYNPIIIGGGSSYNPGGCGNTGGCNSGSGNNGGWNTLPAPIYNPLQDNQIVVSASGVQRSMGGFAAMNPQTRPAPQPQTSNQPLVVSADSPDVLENPE